MNDKEDFDKDLYYKQLNDFDNIYYGVMSYLATIQDESAVTYLPRHKSHVSLPTIHLPSFYGKPTEMINFSNLFSTLMVSNEHLSNFEKLLYLKSSQLAEPLSLIQLPMTADNFVAAWQLLNKRFNKKRLIVSDHLDALVQTSTVSLSSPAIVTTFVSLLKEHAAAL
ncbi:hypothetical protein PR048_002298 [Dryococelus australis]|uniref:Uncharacterized protein n=1 Tax=Dryococelus australis TaxID=614101 RepID=A0ABQ9IJW5_9NEOP|nr:hypothetical protein PR048_002298 [Dryococelus australis]